MCCVLQHPHNYQPTQRLFHHLPLIPLLPFAMVKIFLLPVMESLSFQH
jgi:hypothetical protein